MKFHQLAALGCLLGSSITAVTPVKRQNSGTATLYLDQPSGKPEKLASGFIYGIPDNADGSANTDIPTKYFKDMGFNYCRAGGAQGRWKSALSNYCTTRRRGGKFILLIHDLWGTDGTQGAEPDLNLFWNAPQTQYLNLRKRTYERIWLVYVIAELPDVLITRPSTAAPPSVDNQWYQNYLKYIARTNTIPDVYSWHLLNPSRNLREFKEQFQTLLKKYKLPERPININEYAWISQLERHNAHGLRANWGSGGGLHDLMANLFVNNTGDYSPTGEWQVYSYYNKEMKGQRVATSPSDDELFEVHATRGGSAGPVKVLAAIRLVAGKRTCNLSISGLLALKITGSTVRVRKKRLDGATRETAVSGSVDLGVFRHTISNDQVSGDCT
ncbi:hypothetical protein EDB81DRAFT_840306 [Dactylonectria macrodidyma]|uniref:Uncharacterized protein n=1 Tax=Dactylonectria macrodidyma TaxID=307937 RepID=A0A9P9F971_9HYPO|nr:hypothetical protein EDB81DRAFT_840306 [Dactylonectria macrodidyma]